MLAPKSQRIAWIDNVKAFAILCVIIGHSQGLLEIPDSFSSNFGALIVAFNMPLFVIMAGWTALRSLERIVDLQSCQVFFEKLFERTVLPSVAFSALYAILQGELFARRLWLVYSLLAIVYYLLKCDIPKVPERIRTLVRMFLSGVLIFLSFRVNYFWFLAMIIEFQALWGMLCWVFHRLKPELKLSLAFVAFVFFVFATTDGWLTEFVIYYAFGMFLRYSDAMDKWQKMPVWSMFLILAITAIVLRVTRSYCFYGYGVAWLIQVGKGWIFALRQLNGLLLSMLAVYWVRKFTGSYNAWSRFGSFSMALYMVHSLILDYWPMSFSGSDPFVHWLRLLLIVILLTSISYGFILGLNWWRLPRKIFLGKDVP